jgi:3-oxoacyl-[acyl-carrier protein] reductase
MKTALITGSTQGIGRQIGIDLINSDYFVYFNGHTLESIEKLKHDLNYNYANDHAVIPVDLSTIYDNLALANYIKGLHVSLNVLVLNLGITDRTPFGEISPAKWNHVFETNLSGAFFLIQELRDNIKENGQIIFITSISGCSTDSTSIAYGVSKGAIHVLVPYLAKEFAKKNITVNAICPGYIATNWHSNKSSSQMKRIAKKHLVNRLGTPEEISKAVLGVIDNSFINGQIIRVDGGFLL